MSEQEQKCPEEHRRAVVLLSGGMDSATLIHYVRSTLGYPEVHALSFQYGQKHVRELAAAKWQAKQAGVAHHAIVDISIVGELVEGASALTDMSVAIPDLADMSEEERQQPRTYVPNRNMLLLSLAAAYAEARTIRHVYYGAQAQDEYGYWDCTREFVEAINSLLALNRRSTVRILAPFMHMRKADELRLGIGLGVDYSRTWSCYRGLERPCATCPACIERSSAFAEVGIQDPLLVERRNPHDQSS